MATIAALGTALLGAGASVYGSNQASKAAKNAGGKPTQTTSAAVPWAPAGQDYLTALEEARRLYNDPTLRTPPPMLKAGKGGRGTSKSSQALLDAINKKALGGSRTVDAAERAIQDTLAGKGNPHLDETFQAAKGAKNANLDEFIRRGMADGGFDKSDPYMRQFIESMFSKTKMGGAVPSPAVPRRLASGGSSAAASAAAGADGAAPAPKAAYISRSDRAAAVRADQEAARIRAAGGSEEEATAAQNAVLKTQADATAANGGVPPPAPPVPTATGGGPGLWQSGQYAKVPGPGGPGPVGSAGYIRGILEADPGTNPYLDQMIANANKKIQEQYQSGLAGLSASAEAAGAYGGSSHQLADAAQAQKYAQSLAESETGARYQDYRLREEDRMKALGYGTQLDASIYGADQQRAAQEEAARASASAYGSAARDQTALAREGMLMDAIRGYGQAGLSSNELLGGAVGQDVGLQQFGLGLMGDLSGQFGQEKLGALGLVPGINETGYYGLQAALGAQGAADARSAAGAGRAADIANRNAMAQWEYGQNRPGQLLDEWTNRINALAGQFAPETSMTQELAKGNRTTAANPYLVAQGSRYY